MLCLVIRHDRSTERYILSLADRKMCIHAQSQLTGTADLFTNNGNANQFAQARTRKKGYLSDRK